METQSNFSWNLNELGQGLANQSRVIKWRLLFYKAHNEKESS